MTGIRSATDHDCGDIHDVYMLAFPERENHIVASLAVSLLGEETSPETIALVAEASGKIVGHIAFSPVTARSESNWSGYILAPLGVKPAYQKCGVGKKLIERGITQLREKAVNVIIVYGDPGYYERYGFSADAATRFSPPYKLQYPFGWQALVLKEGKENEIVGELLCVKSLRNPALW
ncbi:MAG: N-acetyltransferase [Gammaproteobacteria bacterium]|nr:N-acetyltransferase [Gammaproteobacteria bacterium]